MAVGDQATTLGPGDFIAFSADRPHTYDVVGGPVRGVMLMTYPDVPAPDLDGRRRRPAAGHQRPVGSGLRGSTSPSAKVASRSVSC